MLRAHICAINLFLGEPSLNSVVLQHVMGCLVLDLLVHVLEGVVPGLDSGFTDPEGIPTILDLFPLLLTVLLNVSDGLLLILLEYSLIVLILRILFDSTLVFDELHLYLPWMPHKAVGPHILDGDLDTKVAKLIKATSLPHGQDCHFAF